MKSVKIMIVMMTAAVMVLWGIGDVYARGGFHGGGGFRGGGYHEGGGEFHGGEERGEGRGDRPGEHGSGEYHGGDHDHGDHGGDHGHNTNNTNSGNNVTVNGYGWGDNAVAGLVVGTALGAVAVGAAQPDTVVVEQPVQTIVQQGPAIGTQVATLPGGATATNVGGTLYYQSNNIWYRPYFGGSGVYYQVVQPPQGPQ